MIGPLLRLEFVKQRGGLLLLPPAIIISFVARNHPEVLFGGICFTAMVFGATAGVQLRTEPELSSEAALPVHVFHRVLAALLISGLDLLLVTAVTIIFSATLQAYHSWSATMWRTEVSLRLAILSAFLPRLLLLSFSMSYWLRSAISGGGLALLVGTVELLGGRILIVARMDCGFPMEVVVLFCVAAIAGLGGAVASLRAIAFRAHLEAPIGYARGVIYALFAIPIFTGCIFVWYFLVGMPAAVQIGRQRTAMLELRVIGTAVEEYAEDHGHYPDTQSLYDLELLLSPRYVRTIPRKDPWGNQYRYMHYHHVLVMTSFPWRKEPKDEAYFIGSSGRDQAWEKAEFTDYEPNVFDTFDGDIVFGNGSFVCWPSGPQC